MNELSFEERLSRVEKIAEGVPAREARVDSLHVKGVTIIDTLSQIVRMIENLQQTIGDCNIHVVQSAYNEQADA